jgi:chemotaxis response regulator CheB
VIPLRVLVVEREGEHQLADVVRNAAQTELVALATTGAQALAQTLRLRPGAVLMAANVLAPDAIATTREIMTLAPAPVIVVIDEADGTAERARASAHGAGAIATVTPPPAPHAAAYAARCSALIDTLCAVAAVPLVRRRPQRPAARTSRGGRRHGHRNRRIDRRPGGLVRHPRRDAGRFRGTDSRDAAYLGRLHRRHGRVAQCRRTAAGQTSRTRRTAV